MKIYISGPITNDPDYMEHFNEAEERLKAKGYEVINPARSINDLMKSIGWELDYNSILCMDIAMLQSCDAIYMLRGYRNSNGAKTERIFAVMLGKKFMSEEEERYELDDTGA